MARSRYPPPLATTRLLDFSLAHPLHDDLSNESRENDLWNHLSRAVYGIIVPGTRTYATFGHSGGNESGVGYKIVQDNGRRTGGSSSFAVKDNYHYYCLWDVNDLVRVRAGRMKPNEVRPYEYGTFRRPSKVRRTSWQEVRSTRRPVGSTLRRKRQIANRKYTPTPRSLWPTGSGSSHRGLNYKGQRGCRRLYDLRVALRAEDEAVAIPRPVLPIGDDDVGPGNGHLHLAGQAYVAVANPPAVIVHGLRADEVVVRREQDLRPLQARQQSGVGERAVVADDHREPHPVDFEHRDALARQHATPAPFAARGDHFVADP